MNLLHNKSRIDYKICVFHMDLFNYSEGKTYNCILAYILNVIFILAILHLAVKRQEKCSFVVF